MTPNPVGNTEPQDALPLLQDGLREWLPALALKPDERQRLLRTAEPAIADGMGSF